MDDDFPIRRNDTLAALTLQDLDPLSIEELEDRIEQLQAEIARCEAKKAAASKHMTAADALFKKG